MTNGIDVEVVYEGNILLLYYTRTHSTWIHQYEKRYTYVYVRILSNFLDYIIGPVK